MSVAFNSLLSGTEHRSVSTVNNAGTQVEKVESKVTLRLYFANETGDGLVAVNRASPSTLCYPAQSTEASAPPQSCPSCLCSQDSASLSQALSLFYSEKYKELSGTTEVLTRAALVRSLTNIPDVNYVMLTVNGESSPSVRKDCILS